MRRRMKSSRPVRPMDWECAQSSLVLGTAAFGSKNTVCTYAVLPSNLRQFYTDPTLMASRAYLAIRSALNQDSGATFAGIGLIAWDDTNDFCSSVDAPDPILDCNLDWINRWVAIFPSGSNAGTFANPNIFDITHLSKAKRRLGNQKGLLLTFSAYTTGAVNTISFGIDIRCLIKE